MGFVGWEGLVGYPMSNPAVERYTSGNTFVFVIKSNVERACALTIHTTCCSQLLRRTNCLWPDHSRHFHPRVRSHDREKWLGHRKIVSFQFISQEKQAINPLPLARCLWGMGGNKLLGSRRTEKQSTKMMRDRNRRRGRFPELIGLSFFSPVIRVMMGTNKARSNGLPPSSK